jgi:hypothetical protein
LTVFAEESIYIGTDEGVLLQYTTDGSLKQKKNLGHGKKPIEKILIFGDLMKLVTLCGNKLFQ